MSLVLQKAVIPQHVDSFLNEGFDRVSGYVVRAAEVSDVVDLATLRTLHMTAYEGSPYPESGPLHVLHFERSPAWDLTPAEKMTERDVLSTSGTVALSDRLVSVFYLGHTRLTPGARLWRFHDGVDPVHVATYLGPAFGWQNHEKDGARAVTLPTATTGPIGVLDDKAFVAAVDTGEDGVPTSVTLIAPVEPPEELGFTRLGAFWGKEVSHSDLRALFEIRIAALWNGIPVSVAQNFTLQDGRNVSRVVSLTHDWEANKAAGLTEIELGVWEATVPATEVLNVTPQEVASKGWMTPWQVERIQKAQEASQQNVIQPSGTTIEAIGFASDAGTSQGSVGATSPDWVGSPLIPATSDGEVRVVPGTVLDEPGTGMRDQAHLGLYQRIAQGTIPHLPKEAVKVTVICQGLGNVLEIAAQAENAAGEPIEIPTVSQDVAQAFGELRNLSNQHEEDPWFAAVVVITSDGQLQVHFQREQKPQLHRPFTAEMVEVERARFPRKAWPEWFEELERELGGDA